MIKKNQIIFLLLITLNFHYAQKDSVYYGDKPNKAKPNSKKPSNEDFRKKLIFGGNFSLLFGSYTLVNLSPIIGYRFTEKFHAGVGLIYYYSSMRYGNTKYTQNFYGTDLFARFFIQKNLFLQGQYDRLNQYNYQLPNWTNEKIWVDYVMVGGGYRQPLGERSAFMVSIMYNLTPSPLSIYYNPYFQMGVAVGF